MKTPIIAAYITLFMAVSPAHAQETIAAARELYTAANYEDALVMLSRLDLPSTRTPERLAINQYKAFCLLALGRTSEAERAIEAVVSADPLFRPADSDASPRLRTAFSSVRQRILPAVVQQRYANAKAAYDRKDFATATSEFDRVLQALDDPDLGGAATRSPLAELKTLATGFRELSSKAAEPPPAPAPVPAAVPPPTSPLVAAGPTGNIMKRIYNGTEGGVLPPVPLHQSMPPFPREVAAFANRTGMLEVIIDEFGDVESAKMIGPINPRYDNLVVNAAKAWKYRPASAGGTPVKYRKMITIALKPGGEN
jgi:hypothetical protein